MFFRRPVSTGTVCKVQGGRYEVAVDVGGPVEASLRGRLKTQARTGDRVVIGDRVRVSGGGDGGHTIEEVLARETELVRRGPGGRKPKVLAANLDRLLVVVAAVDPEAQPRLVDRLLAVGESSRIPCLLLINKLDLPGATRAADTLAELYGSIGYEVLETSARSGEGLDRLRSVLCPGSSALIGPSGVGKSSLLNAVEPDLELRVGEISRRIGRGRHTTVTSRLLPLSCGGWVADTPGLGDVGLWGVDPSDLDRLFPELRARSQECRFRGCTHLHEPECAVLDALERGDIHRSRFDSYRTLREETTAA